VSCMGGGLCFWRARAVVVCANRAGGMCARQGKQCGAQWCVVCCVLRLFVVLVCGPGAVLGSAAVPFICFASSSGVHFGAYRGGTSGAHLIVLV